MKKLLFWVLILISAYLLISVSTKLFFDFSRLTNYGFGFIVGQGILLIIFALTATMIKRKT